jgi:CRP/FNR family transcriptional regulator, cyclic AMP receptor protein
MGNALVSQAQTAVRDRLCRLLLHAILGAMRSHLLDVLDDDEQRDVLRATRRRRFKRNEVVFHDGDPADTLHLVVEGHFAIRITTPLGDQAMVRVFGPADYFGELAMLSSGPRRGSAISLDGGETLSLHREDFQRLRATRPKVDEVLTDALVAEVRRLSAALMEALYVPVERRVWLRLVDLVALYGGDTPVVIPITQDEIAQLAGTTRPTANRVLRAGEEQGALQLSRGRIEVHDRAALQRLAR